MKLSQIERIKDTRNLSLSGKYRYYPYNFKGFNKTVPGMIEEPTIITSYSSGAKSSIMKFLYILQAIKLAIEKDLKYHLILFALEDDDFIIRDTILCHLYYEEYDEIICTKLLNGFKFDKNGKVITLTENQLLRIEKLIPLVDKFMTYVTVYDDLYTTNEIHNAILKFSCEHGRFFKNKSPMTNIDVLSGKPFDTYVKRDFDFVSVVTDHISLLNECEDQKNIYDAIGAYSKLTKQIYVKKLGYAPCFIQQQSEENASLSNVKNDYFLPAMNGLADRKSTAKDARLIIGICNVQRFKQKTYHGYQIEGYLKGFYRVLNVIKQTTGEVNGEFSCLFLPHTCHFFLLPIVDKEKGVPPEVEQFINKILSQIKEYDDL